MNKTNLSELFALPIGMKEVAKIEGISLLSNDNLKTKFSIAMSKMDKTKPISSTIDKLVKNGSFLPCFLSKGIFKLLKFKIFDPHDIVLRDLKHVVGFFDLYTKKIYILIDNNVNLIGYASNKELADTTIHECIHMVSMKKPSQFLKLFGTELRSFYSYILDSIFKVKTRTNPKDIEKIIEYIHKNAELTLSRSNKVLVDYYKLLDSIFSKNSSLDNDKFYKTLNDYIVIIKVYWKNVNAFYSLQRNFRHILSPIYSAYKEVFNVKMKYTAIQELIAPSECICILSGEDPGVKTYSAIKLL